jgi:hypothetical protein
MQRHGGDGAGDLLIAPGLGRTWRIERGGDIGACPVPDSVTPPA